MPENTIETKNCKHCNISFDITDKDLEFYSKISPVFAGKKYIVPAPTLCPECRQQRRLSFRNERKLYKRNCDATGKQIISIFSPDKPYKVYNSEFWWSDKWDAIDYGINFDFSRGFFEQFDDLQLNIPKINSWIQNSENCDYTNFMRNGKDNYLSFASSESEKVFYSTWTTRSYNSIDCLYSNKVNNSYYLFQCHNSSNLFYCQYCNNSSNLYYCYGCESCNNCFLSSNLSNKSYYFQNIQLTENEYKQKVSKYLKNLKSKEVEKRICVPDIISSENSLGCEIYNCKNCINCFGINDSEDCKYCYEQFGGQKDCMDCMGSVGILCYESGISVKSYNNISVIDSSNCDFVYYSFLCNNSSNIFGCVGLKNKSYCIFNKQYTKEEYEEIVPNIIEHMMKTGEWGEFFPSSISPFGYNETVAMEYFPILPPLTPPYEGGGQVQVPPLTRGRLGGGFKWSDYESPLPNVEKVIKANQLPQNITEIPDDILNWAIECEITKKPFRIVKAELEFYRKHNLPIPRRHPDQRHLDRMSLRNPRKLYDRKCDKCGIDMKTTYSQDRKELVYCEKCYEKEIY